MTVRSRPFEVNVRELPGGAPAGFEGAVGRFTLAWSADRDRTPQDVPVRLRLDVRGPGNLPLVQPPRFELDGAEVFSGTAEDSLGRPGTLGAARRRFQWNVLPDQTGVLSIPAPSFAWFDPGAGRYRSARLPALRVVVDPPVFSAGEGPEGFPAVFMRQAQDPFARGVAPWVWALAGLLAGAAAVLWRSRPAADPYAGDRARVAGWRNALRAPGGPAFWRAAEEAAEWLAARGRVAGEVSARIEATRYGGGGADPGEVRLRLAQDLEGALPPARRQRPTRPAAVVLAVVALALAVLGAVQPGQGANEVRLHAADQVARSGGMVRARAAWEEMWREGARSAALAARLAWAEATQGALGPAAVWVLRGEAAEARDPALAWASDLVREGGGLAGQRPVRLPVRRSEWAVLALVLGVASGALWPRRRAVLALAVLAALAGAMDPLQDWWAAGAGQAVIARTVALEGTGLSLETGQVVREIERQGTRARVRVGRDLGGWVPADALMPVMGLP
jgi:hypothetical protein